MNNSSLNLLYLFSHYLFPFSGALNKPLSPDFDFLFDQAIILLERFRFPGIFFPKHLIPPGTHFPL